MKLIIGNDDLGMTYGFTDGIKSSYLNGITTSTSIRTNGSAYTYATKHIKGLLRGIGLGLHLNLCQGQPHRQELADNNRQYRLDFLGYYFRLMRKNKSLLQAIRRELAAQFEIVFNDHLSIDHVSGHDHIHMIPPIFEIVCQLCRQYGIKHIRLVNEPFYYSYPLDLLNQNFLKWIVLKSFVPENRKTLAKYKLTTTEAFYGLLLSGKMGTKALKASINDALSRKLMTVEILLHPAQRCHPKDTSYISRQAKWYSNLPERQLELKTLTDPSLKKFLNTNQITLSTYQNL